MTNDTKPPEYQGIPNQVNSLVTALAQKGKPGIVLLAIIFLTIWSPAGLMVYLFFDFLGAAKDFSNISIGSGPVIATAIVGILGAVYIYIAYRLTMRIISMMIPTIKAEAEVALAQAFQGRVMTSSGKWDFMNVDKEEAQTRVKQIMKALLDHIENVLQVGLLRANIFTLREDGRLRILDDFHLNMVAEKELTISIPNGFLSTGWAYKYYRPTLSLKLKSGWPYTSEEEQLKKEIALEVDKVDKKLVWIISMPIPYKVKPFKLVAGVLNIDGLAEAPSEKHIVKFLNDFSTAVALISVLNRGTGLLDGVYSIPSKPDPSVREQLKDIIEDINPGDFDPATCPEPTRKFVEQLSHVPGLEFFAWLSPSDVSSFLRDQLR